LKRDFSAEANLEVVGGDECVFSLGQLREPFVFPADLEEVLGVENVDQEVAFFGIGNKGQERFCVLGRAEQVDVFGEAVAPQTGD